MLKLFVVLVALAVTRLDADAAASYDCKALRKTLDQVPTYGVIDRPIDLPNSGICLAEADAFLCRFDGVAVEQGVWIESVRQCLEEPGDKSGFVVEAEDQLTTRIQRSTEWLKVLERKTFLIDMTVGSSQPTRAKVVSAVRSYVQAGDAAFGPGGVRMLEVLHDAAWHLNLLGHYEEAGAYLRRSMATARGASDIKTLELLEQNLDALGQHRERLGVLERLQAIYEASGTWDKLSGALQSAAWLNTSLGRLGEARHNLERAVRLHDEGRLGVDPSAQQRLLASLASTRFAAGDFGVAGEIWERFAAEEFAEAVIPGSDCGTKFAWHMSLVEYYLAARLFAEVDGLFDKLEDGVLKIIPQDPEKSICLTNAMIRRIESHLERDEAEKALQVYRRLSLVPISDAPDEIFRLYALGRIQIHMAKFSDVMATIAQLRRVQSRLTDVADQLIARGIIYELLASAEIGLGRLSSAEKSLRLQLDNFQKQARNPVLRSVVDLDHPDVSAAKGSLATLLMIKGAEDEALKMATDASRAIVAKMLGLVAMSDGLTFRVEPVYWRSAGEVLQALLNIHERAKSTEVRTKAAALGFEVAQVMQYSAAARAIQLLSDRARVGSTEDSSRLRELQDIALERSTLVGRATRVRNSGDNRDALVDLGRRIDELDARTAELTKNLRGNHFGVTVSGDAVGFDAVRRLLKANEALALFYLPDSREPRGSSSFVWLLTTDNIVMARIKGSTSSIREDVERLRCDLDPTLTDASRFPTGEGLSLHEKALRSRMTDCIAHYSDGKTSARNFDFQIAHRLYRVLFSGVERALLNRDLIVVTSGPISELPLGVLLTDKPSEGATVATGNIPWLIRRTSLAVMPTVSAFTAMRLKPTGTRNRVPYLGFGNPLFHGNPEDEGDRRRFLLARELVSCAATVKNSADVGSVIRASGSVTLKEGRVADRRLLSAQSPLPNTAREVCSIAQAHGVGEEHVYLASRASEANLRRLNEAGALLDYSIIHFATHGIAGGEISTVNEPGLILAPPDADDEADDGFLSITEIMQLRLNARWVVLSACNTASPAHQWSGALSGLARAFFYAGADAVLVSHWAVWSAATERLISDAVANSSTEPRAAALRRAMMRMLDGADVERRHPMYWGAFVVVGEGF